MSTSYSDRMMISTNAPNPELLKLIRHCFRECGVDEIQNILMDREKHMKMEMENLVRDGDAIKEEARLLERIHGLAELEKLKAKEKCEELKETVSKLRLEKKNMATEKNKLILELNAEIDELKNENTQSKRLVGVYQEKLECWDEILAKLGKENEDLKREKLAANQSLEELRRKQLEADQVVEKLKRQNVGANQNINELRLKGLESEKEAELYKNQLEKLAPRIMTVEKELASILKVKVEDLGGVVDSLDRLMV